MMVEQAGPRLVMTSPRMNENFVDWESEVYDLKKFARVISCATFERFEPRTRALLSRHPTIQLIFSVLDSSR